jgi:hypothetical protein
VVPECCRLQFQEHIVGLRDPKSLAEKDGPDSGGGPSGSDASQAAITLAMLLTDEELDSLEKRAGHGESALGAVRFERRPSS